MDIIFKIDATEKFTGGSDAYVHRVKQFLNVKGKNKEVATLHLPTGHWVVSAKAGLLSNFSDSDPGSWYQVVRCWLTVDSLDRLGVANSAEDRTANSMTHVPVPLPGGAVGEGHEAYHYETTTLLLGVDLKSGGYVRLIADSNYNVTFTDIVISAIRVNSLTIETI